MKFRIINIDEYPITGNIYINTQTNTKYITFTKFIGTLLFKEQFV